MGLSVRYKIRVENGKQFVDEIHKLVVHRIRMGDVEDPDLMVADPIWRWQQTDAGKFVMEHAVDTPEWHRHVDYQSYGHQYAIVAELDSKKLAEFYMRWGKVE
jgi:hypothetical protein